MDYVRVSTWGRGGGSSSQTLTQGGRREFHLIEKIRLRQEFYIKFHIVSKFEGIGKTVHSMRDAHIFSSSLKLTS